MFIYTVLFVFYNLYINIVRLSSTMIYCVTIQVPLSRFFSPSVLFMKIYICPKKQNSVIYLSFYHVSIFTLEAVNRIP